ncbi:MAG: hypothetical protein M3N68_00960, partial [Actinomycetota bacterium]|nr:hypothetical protein [Actinomycetota bacterium]
PGPTPGPPVSGPLEAAMKELQAFVERERGLAFKRPVKVSLLADAAFDARIVSTDEEARKEVADAQAVLQAMGLLPAGVDLWKAVVKFVEGAALGFYDASTDELVVRGAEPTPFVRTTLVHELTHALEDQHFDLDRADLGDEAAVGFESLVEGSALHVERRYLTSLSASERRKVEEEEEGRGPGPPADVPAVVEEAFGFPYTYGPALVRSLLLVGGRARLDAAYADPPLSSEQVLDPGRYLRGDRPRPVPVPRADAPPFDDGEIGRLFLELMLDARLGRAQASEAAVGWGGDRYAAWKDGRRTCVRMDFVMDTPADADQLARALSSWAATRRGSASSSGTSLTTCG